MNKKLKIFLFFSFVLSLFFPGYICKASSLALSADTLSMINEGTYSLEYVGFSGYDVLPFLLNTHVDKPGEYVLNKYGSQTISSEVTNSHITPVSISFDDLDVMQSQTFYDKNGNPLTIDDISCYSFDNGSFSGSFIVDSNGDIVYTDYSNENPYLNCRFGGRDITFGEWQSIYSNASEGVKLNGYNYDLNDSGLIGSNATYYLWCGGSPYDRPGNVESLFIANQYIPGQIMALNDGGRIHSWYCNDLSLVTYTDFGGGGSYSVRQGNYTLNGYNYSYLIDFGSYTDWRYVDVKDYQQAVNGAYPGTAYYCFAKDGYVYDGTLANGDTVAFKKLNPVGDTVDLSKNYSYADIMDSADTLAKGKGTANRNFDGSQAISEDNYPVSYIIEISMPISVIVMPGEAEGDDIAEEAPAIEYPFDESIPDDGDLGNLNIPILSDLQNRFPFSIPWDMKNLLKGLRAYPKAPRFQGDIVITPLNYTYHVDIDLSMFDEQAELFRLLFLISFVIGLAIFSYNHFFGS